MSSYIVCLATSYVQLHSLSSYIVCIATSYVQLHRMFSYIVCFILRTKIQYLFQFKRLFSNLKCCPPIVFTMFTCLQCKQSNTKRNLFSLKYGCGIMSKKMCTVLYCMYSIVLDVQYCIVCTVLYCMYSIVLYCIVQYYIV